MSLSRYAFRYQTRLTGSDPTLSDGDRKATARASSAGITATGNGDRPCRLHRRLPVDRWRRDFDGRL